MKRLGIALLFLLAVSPASAEKNLLCGGMLENQPVFLIAEGRNVILTNVDGKELLRENKVIAADISDNSCVAFLKEDSVVWLDEKLQAHVITITKIPPYLSLIKEATQLALTEKDMLLVPEEIPYLLNLKSGARMQFADALTLNGEKIRFDGMGAVWVFKKWIVLQKERALQIVDRNSLERAVAVPLQHSTVADIWLEGKKIHILLQNGAGYRVVPSTGTVKKVPKNKDDEALIRQHVRFWNDTVDSVVKLRLKDQGALSLMSAWKEGRMEAEISVKSPDRETVVHGLTFSMKKLGKFRFNLRQISGVLVLDFHEKDIVVIEKAGHIHFLTIMDGKPYAVAGGVIYTPDSSGKMVRHEK